MRNFPRTTVVILNWNAAEETIESCRSVLASSYPVGHVVLVDNGSTDESAIELHRWLSHYGGRRDPRDLGSAVAYTYGSAVEKVLPVFSLVLSEVNLGYAGGCNLAIRFCLSFGERFDYLILFNNDGRMMEHTLAELVVAAEESGAGIVAGTMIDPDTDAIEGVEEVTLPVPCVYVLSHLPGLYQLVNKLWRWSESRRSAPLSRSRRTGRVWGPMLLIRREVLEQMEAAYGRFLNEELFMYGEETDLSYLVRKLGWTLASAPKATFYHRIGRKNQPRIYYYSTRNAFHLSRMMLPAILRWPFYMIVLVPFYGLSALRHHLHGRIAIGLARMAGILDGFLHKKGQWQHH